MGLSHVCHARTARQQRGQVTVLEVALAAWWELWRMPQWLRGWWMRLLLLVRSWLLWWMRHCQCVL